MLPSFLKPYAVKTEDLIRIMVECADLKLLKSTIEIISKAIIKENDNK